MTLSIGVFCGTKTGTDERFVSEAREVGKRIALADYRLVYGAGHIGMMGAVSQGALENQNEDADEVKILGIIPSSLVRRENAGHRPHRVMETKTLDQRKTWMFRESDAFVALAGGLGTMDELFEAVTLSQIGGHTSTRIPVKEKPLFILNTLDYFRGTIIQLETMVEFGFLSVEDRRRITVAYSVDELMTMLSKLE